MIPLQLCVFYVKNTFVMIKQKYIYDNFSWSSNVLNIDLVVFCMHKLKKIICKQKYEIMIKKDIFLILITKLCS